MCANAREALESAGAKIATPAVEIGYASSADGVTVIVADNVDAFCHDGSPICLVVPAACAGRNRFGFSSLSDRLQFAICCW